MQVLPIDATLSIGGVRNGAKRQINQKTKIKTSRLYILRAEVLLNYLNFQKSNKGKTSGSRVIFTSNDHGSILLHKPHPRKELLDYQVKQLREKLEQETSYEKSSMN